jgi:hypothetical protein
MPAKGAGTMKNIRKLMIPVLGAAIALLIAQGAQAEKPIQPYYENVALRYDIQEPRKIDLKYDVYAGGFHALDASLAMDLDRKAYDVGLDAKTQGFIGKLFPWQATYTTSGHTEKGVLVPTVSTSRSQWRDRVKMTELNFNPKGEAIKATTQEGSSTTINRDISKSVAGNAVDLLTGALLMMQSAKNSEKCEGTFPVFDGKRRFNVTLTDDGKDVLRKSKLSKFKGEALRCKLKVEPVAGFSEKDKKRGWLAVQAHTEQRRKEPTLWLGRISEDGPIVPVRMEIASEYGAVVAHLTNVGAK